MPQEGDSVKLYLPEADEGKAYIKIINRTDGGENPKTSDPRTKYLGTIDGRELKMAEKELLLTTTEGKMYIRMQEDEGIAIESDRPILVKSDDRLNDRGYESWGFGQMPPQRLKAQANH